ncbi:hypothetical protein [Maribacter halichondriae]|uniref:hypothetical protein n=1 Tax=Maribacter halichondriae TaxID=2980554 RepID=UPI00235979EF|nr:hypothetical protein [Maribacter sp. Hal144]
MKIILRTAALAALIIAISCGKDDAVVPDGKADEIAEQLEQTPLEANTVSENVVIKGGAKKEGMPPTPNEAITLDVSNTSKMALLGEGFEVSLNSDAEIVGAYIQFKSNDGTMADSYYDIDLFENTISDKKSIKTDKKGLSNSLTAKVDADANIDIDFNTQIEPGTFCYDVCVYDADGNISLPQEVCVTVESWGGNSALVAKWNLTKEEYDENGEIDVDITGEEECATDTQECSDGGSFEYTECYVSEFGYIEFKQDGTFTLESKGGEEYLDYNNSLENCEATYKEYIYHFTGSGNWAYSSVDKQLSLVLYSSVDKGTDGEGTQTNEPGEGELIFSGKAEINGNTLVIIEEDYTSYFEK